MKNKYYFFKKLYKDYVIILDDKGIRKSFGYDKLLIKYINKIDINYIIVDNNFNVVKVDYKINYYKRYLMLEFLLFVVY